MLCGVGNEDLPAVSWRSKAGREQAEICGVTETESGGGLQTGLTEQEGQAV